MEAEKQQAKQLRIDYQLAREIEIAAAVEGISIKEMMGRVWRERKNFEFSFFRDKIKIESESSDSDAAVFYLLLVASVLNRSSEDRDRKWLVGSLELLLDRVKLMAQGRDA